MESVDEETGKEDETGSLSAGSRSSSRGREAMAQANSSTGNTRILPEFPRTLLTPTRFQHSEQPAQLRGRPRRGRAMAAGDGRASRGLRRGEVPRGRLNIADAPRFKAITEVDRRRPLSKDRLPPRQLPAARPRDRPPRRQTTQDGAGVRHGPRDDSCYAFCLADRVDIRRLEALWLKRRSAAVAATAAAAIAAVAAASKRLAGSSDTATAAAAAAARTSPSHTPEVQVVRLNKEVSLLKVGRKDCFVFSFGCLVCWSCTLDQAKCAKEYLQEVLLDPLPSHSLDEDSMLIAPRDGRTPEVRLSSRDPPTFERVAVAYALAQSVRLGSLELRIDRAIARVRPIPQTMVDTGEVGLSHKEVTKMVGELFVLRNQVNLHTDILDTPEIFWEYEDYEPLYARCRQHLDVAKRVSILNQRFEVLQDLFDVLDFELHEREETRLTHVIIVLCAIEAFVMALRLYTRVYASGYGASDSGSMAITPILGTVNYIFNFLKGIWQGGS